jgi:diguanylate cyclase (GGDEF)-like protein/PAS domain S-box-containing protein
VPRGREVPSELGRLLDTSPDAVLLVNRAGIIVAVNGRVEALFGVSARELRGHPVEVLLPARFREHHRKARTDYGQTPTLRAMSARTGLLGRRADGAEFPVEVSLTPVTGSPEGLVMAVVHDASARSRTEVAIGPEGRVGGALDAIPDAVLVTDARGNLDFLNRTAEELTGHRLMSARGLPIETVLPLVDAPDDASLTDRIAACLGQGAPTEAWEVALSPAKDRERQTLDVSIGPLRNASGAITGAAIIARDVTRARHIAKELAHQATHDPLTGLVNRPEFERRLARALAGTEAGGGEHALCFLDLDGFKSVNDACGHLAGDELLRQLSRLMRDHMRARDTVARLGGDEFGVLLEHCGLARAARVAAKIRKAISDHRFTWGDTTHRVGVSVGIVPIRGGGRPREILRAADSACYVAKRAGGNRVQVQDHRAPLAVAPTERELLHSVRHAAQEDRFRLYAQPLVALGGGNGATPRLELLLRMDAGGELVPPSGFLPTARRHGLMPHVDEWVVRRAVEGLARWQRAHPGANPPTVAVNLADETVAGGDAVAVISRALAEEGVAARALCLEIGESAVVADPTRTADLLRALRAAGCQTAVEHCGTGMAAFTLLQGLALDYLKIAGHVVRGLVRDPISRILADALNQVGHSLGLRTIGAEAEDDVAIAALRVIGVDLVQGFCVGRPEPFEAALVRLAVLSRAP